MLKSYIPVELGYCLVLVSPGISENEPLRWRHNGRDSVSNHQPYDCLLNRLFRRRSKKTSKLRVTGPCVGNSPGTVEFPAQMASNAENVSIWWRHHGVLTFHEEGLQYLRHLTAGIYRKCKFIFMFPQYNSTCKELKESNKNSPSIQFRMKLIRWLRLNLHNDSDFQCNLIAIRYFNYCEQNTLKYLVPR